ncbi:MAG TPA: alpha-amylase family glycosyl hydrolase [bacterium]|nr:alpha-amylase family glycosyl hydrolase [bacterium]
MKKKRRGSDIKEQVRAKLHEEFKLNQFDNTQIWAGNERLYAEGEECEGPVGRVFLDNGDKNTTINLQVTFELYFRGFTDTGILDDGDLDVALWTDINRYGKTDEKGMHYADFGYLVPMHIVRSEAGEPVKLGNNYVFKSDKMPLGKTGVFSYTVKLSADGKKFDDPSKNWISINEIAHNRDGVLVASPTIINSCPSLIEICIRKYGASMKDGEFVSGRIRNVTADIENIPVDVLYLLPIFEPGTGDILTGEDVRKGELGSVYAVRDFFRIDPAICTPPEEVDFNDLVSRDLLTNYDLIEVLHAEQSSEIQNLSDFCRLEDSACVIEKIGRESAQQLAGRAELRELVRAAHGAGKKVVFDLVLMQTSRDSELIEKHLDWYELDEEGAPKRHKIAWLDYSDVALFRLLFNRPLQNYLSSVAPYWISACGFDGVRIDASQTVDRAFLKQIKNRINDVSSSAFVIGETLCALDEAVDIPTDMIYSLLVDHHVNVENAGPYYNLFEQYHRMFSPGTHAMAYFENHDSQRATARWYEKYGEMLANDAVAAEKWKGLLRESDDETALEIAALKNIQCSVINMISGSAEGVNFCYAIENGTDYAERTRTDFENKTLLDFSLREKGVSSMLHHAYRHLDRLKKKLDLVCTGKVYYLRNNLSPDNDDRVYALVRHMGESRILLMANLDPARERDASFGLEFLDLNDNAKYGLKVVFDSYKEFEIDTEIPHKIIGGRSLAEGRYKFELQPLQTLIVGF